MPRCCLGWGLVLPLRAWSKESRPRKAVVLARGLWSLSEFGAESFGSESTSIWSSSEIDSDGESYKYAASSGSRSPLPLHFVSIWRTAREATPGNGQPPVMMNHLIRTFRAMSDDRRLTVRVATRSCDGHSGLGFGTHRRCRTVKTSRGGPHRGLNIDTVLSASKVRILMDSFHDETHS